MHNPTRRDKRFEIRVHTWPFIVPHGLSTVYIFMRTMSRPRVLESVSINGYVNATCLYEEDRYARWRRTERFLRFNNQF